MLVISLKTEQGGLIAQNDATTGSKFRSQNSLQELEVNDAICHLSRYTKCEESDECERQIAREKMFLSSKRKNHAAVFLVRKQALPVDKTVPFHKSKFVSLSHGHCTTFSRDLSCVEMARGRTLWA